MSFYKYVKTGYDQSGIRIEHSVGNNRDLYKFSELLMLARLIFGVTGFGGWVYVSRVIIFAKRDHDNRKLAKRLLKIYRFCIKSGIDIRSLNAKPLHKDGFLCDGDFPKVENFTFENCTEHLNQLWSDHQKRISK